MTNIVKANCLANSSSFNPNISEYDTKKSLKEIAYPQLVRNINPLPQVNTTSFLLNGVRVFMAPGYYEFDDLISLIANVFAKNNVNIEVLINGPNSYGFQNNGNTEVTFYGNQNICTLFGWGTGINTIPVSGFIGPYNMNVSLGADVIEIKISGLRNIVAVPIVGNYLGKVVLIFPNNIKFYEFPKVDTIKECKMSVEYVAINAFETLESPVANRILFVLE
jgi:hypothetical protein